ncbi:MAG: Sun protein [Myxococcota bacterium]|nr:Sun protein [Myxococcota bacterium]
MTRARRKPSTRELAALVIARVEGDGAFASAALEAELARAVQLEERDRALATELVYGSLRVTPWLEREIARFVPRGMGTVDRRVRAHLLVAAYQLFFTRVPAFAAVSEAVDAVTAARGARVGAFANAVLRRVAARSAVSPNTGEALREEAIAASAPGWLHAALGRALSPAGAAAFLRCGTERPPVVLRVERRSEREDWLARLRRHTSGATFDAGTVSPLAILARGASQPQKLPGWTDGAWAVQEEGSQLAALAVGAREGEVVLDACAGRGNKTAILARAVGACGAVDVCDARPNKLERLGQELDRIGLRARGRFAVDWSVGSGDVSGSYDRVLVDAPCSGTGTLRRRPEIALRRGDTMDLAAMGRVQLAIVSRAARHVRRGGSLVYVVCSVLREEAEDVVEAALRECPDFAPAPFDAPEARRIAQNASFFRLLPHVHGTDGYFVARLIRDG